MYEKFRAELVAKIAGTMCIKTAEEVGKLLDVVAVSYTFTKRETALTVYDGGMPELCKLYLMSRSVEGLSKGSIKLYKTILCSFFSAVRKAPGDISTNDVRAWLFGYQHSRKISNRTLNLYREILSGFFSWCSCGEYIAKDPTVQIKPIRYEAKPRKAISQLELEYVRSACKTVRETAVVEVLYSTGCRVSELAGIRLTDIDWAKREVLVVGKGNKTRRCYLNAKAIVALQAYLSSRKDNCPMLIVSERAPHEGVGKSGLERIIRNISDRTKGRLGSKLTPHVFRHTTATTALQNGMPVQDVQRMLGHRSIGTTMIYAETNMAEVKTMHERCVI